MKLVLLLLLLKANQVFDDNAIDAAASFVVIVFILVAAALKVIYITQGIASNRSSLKRMRGPSALSGLTRRSPRDRSKLI